MSPTSGAPHSRSSAMREVCLPHGRWSVVSGRWLALPPSPSPSGSLCRPVRGLYPAPHLPVFLHHLHSVPNILHLEALPPLVRDFCNFIHLTLLSSPIAPALPVPCCSFSQLSTRRASPKGQGFKAYSSGLGEPGPKVTNYP